ncbi:MAG: hypothetical protein ABDH32_03835 [Candidatus Caldarchaeales archaeon]
MSSERLANVLKDRRILREAYTLCRMIIFNLRTFLDTEDYKYLKRAYDLVEYVSSKKEYVENMNGFRDLYNNLKTLIDLLESRGWKLSEEEYGRASEQVTYTIARANIIAMGINFKIKRMR